MTVVAVAAALAACNKAEYVTAKYVTLNAAKYTFDENAGIVKVPVSVFGADECIVKYSITDGSAVQGTDFTIVDKDGQPNTTGLVKLSADKEKNDSIRFKLVYDPAKTKGKKFTLGLLSTTTDGVVVSGTKQCEVTINDLEDAVSKFYGSWSDAAGANAFELEEYDIEKDPDEIAEYYPDCCLAITSGVFGGSCEIGGSIYGYYDGQSQTINLYPVQAFNVYNFSGIGAHFVGLETKGDAEGDIVLSTEGGKLTFVSDVVIRLYTYPDGDVTKYGAGSIEKDTVLEKQK